MNVGEVYWVEFPAAAGRAQSGRRPAVIVQGSNASGVLSTILLVPLTTQQDALRFPGTVLVEPDSENGLSKPSVALVFQLAALDKHFLGKCVGKVSGAVMQAIWQAFDEITERAPLRDAEDSLDE